MIMINNLSKAYADQELFDNVSFQINNSEKVGFIGRNGYGKTTMLRMLTGKEEHDAGDISFPNNYHIGYVEQHINFKAETIIDEACLGLPDEQKHDRWRAEKILSGLGFTNDAFEKSPSILSGGFQIRLNLTKMLLSDPDFLILDEPTNYLDVTSIRWFARFLQDWKKELLLVTHDRDFMDQVTTHTMIVHRKNIIKIAGSTSDLYNKIAMDEEVYEKARANNEKKRAEIDKFISRFKSKATLATRVQSRVKQLNKMEKLDKLDSDKSLSFHFTYKEIKADIIAGIHNLTFGYSKDQPLISNLSLNIRRDDKIAVIGANGKGKTTLLKLLMNELAPQTGEIKEHNLCEKGYFAQTNKLPLNLNNTVEEEISEAHPGKTITEIRNICGTLLFEDDMALKKISVLSGGEKARVLLGKILVKPLNFLLLDEPTNHLDMDSSDSLMEALQYFKGAFIMVTHDESFLRSLANRLIVFDRGKVTIFEGSYDEFLDKIGWESEGEIKKNQSKISNKKDIKRERARIINDKSKALKPIEKQIIQLTEKIENRETRYREIEQEIIDLSTGGGSEKISDLTKQISDIESEITRLYSDMEKLIISQDTIAIEYDTLLEELTYK